MNPTGLSPDESRFDPLHGPKYSDDRLSWWDGNGWKPLSDGPPTSADDKFWWDGHGWHPHHPGASSHQVRRVGFGELVFGLIMLGILAGFALGIIQVKHHTDVGGWTVSAQGYSCWLAPGENWSKTYCGTDSGASHLPNSATPKS